MSGSSNVRVIDILRRLRAGEDLTDEEEAHLMAFELHLVQATEEQLWTLLRNEGLTDVSEFVYACDLWAEYVRMTGGSCH